MCHQTIGEIDEYRCDDRKIGLLLEAIEIGAQWREKIRIRGDTICATKESRVDAGRASRMVQHFRGQLSGLAIEQQEELSRSVACTRDCQQYLDMPDLQRDSGTVRTLILSDEQETHWRPLQEFTSNTNRSMWILRADSTESFEQLLKHIVYRNTFEPVGPAGQRTVSIQTTVKCLGEKVTSILPVFTRRLSIDEAVQSANIEMKGDTNFLVSEAILNQGIYLFQNLSIYTDALEKDQGEHVRRFEHVSSHSLRSSADITDCSISTSPELSVGEQLITPDENLDINNLEKIPTQTGLLLSGTQLVERTVRSHGQGSNPPSDDIAI